MRGSRKDQPRDGVRAEAGSAGCGGLAASQRKRGLAAFSLTRLLYASPLVPRRVNRNGSQQRSVKSNGE